MSLMSFIESLVCLGVLLALGYPALGNPTLKNLSLVDSRTSKGGSVDPIADALSKYGYEKIRNGKYATVVLHPGTWYGAYIGCQSHFPGASLFTVDSLEDDKWLGKRINFEKERISGVSKFWLGLISSSTNRSLFWLSGQAYKQYPNIVQVSGYDDLSKKYAWAVPDGLITKLKYEFLTVSDEAEAYICQYISK